MIKKIRKFIKLSFEEKKLFIEAYVSLGLIRFAILMVSFKYLTRSLEHIIKKKELADVSVEEMKIAQKVGNSIAMASVYTPWKSTCLVQSLVSQRMLQKRNISGVFYLGVAKDVDGKEKIKAHAWSQCGNTIITGAKGYEDYTVVSVFSWK